MFPTCYYHNSFSSCNHFTNPHSLHSFLIPNQTLGPSKVNLVILSNYLLLLVLQIDFVFCHTCMHMQYK